MIPSFGSGDVLPPFVGDSAVGRPRSPYESTIENFVDHFCTSPSRANVLRGLLDYRRALRDAGFDQGFHWLDGSFVENCEVVRGRAPDDIDVVSFLQGPVGGLERFLTTYGTTLLNPDWTKATYRCDAYIVDLEGEPTSVARLSAYWIGVFSHQRDTFRWKGLVQVQFDGSDDIARDLLERKATQW